MAASAALEARGWRFHTQYGRWFRWPAGAGVEGRTITDTYDRGTFLFFEPDLGSGGGGGGAAGAANGAAAAVTTARKEGGGASHRHREPASSSAGWAIRRTAPHFTFSFQYLARGAG